MVPLVMMSALVAAGAAGAHAADTCGVCHIQYLHKDASTPEPALMDTACSAFASGSCCTPETAILASSNSGAELYGPEYRWDRCGPLSPECERFFVAEACWYECAVEAGKYRKHADCAASANGTGNSWQIYHAPMKGSYCDEFYEACKADFFCSSTGTGSFFDTVADECGTLGDIQSNCKSFEELYGSGEALCEKMWDDSFIYVPTTNFSDPDHNASDAFVWDWPANETNPNAAVLDHVEWPDSCNESEHDAWVEFDLKALEECPNVISDGTTGNVTNATGGYNP